MKAIIVGIHESDAYYPVREYLIGKVITFDQDFKTDYLLNCAFEIPEGHGAPESEKLCFTGYALLFQIKVIEE